VTVVRDRKIWTALRTNQIAGFVAVPSWEKIKLENCEAKNKGSKLADENEKCCAEFTAARLLELFKIGKSKPSTDHSSDKSQPIAICGLSLSLSFRLNLRVVSPGAGFFPLNKNQHIFKF